MADYFNQPEGELEADFPVTPRRRRMLTMGEMTGNPFMDLRGAQEQQPLPQVFDTALTMPDVSPLARQQVASQKVRGRARNSSPPMDRDPADYATPDASLTAIPTQGAHAEPPAPADAGSGSAFPKTLQEMQQALFKRYFEKPDEAPLIAEAKRREEGGRRDFAAGLALSALGGQSLAPAGGHVLQQALKDRVPYEIPGGWGSATSEGVTWNPMKAREADLAHLQFIDKTMSDAENRRLSREDTKTRADADRAMREQLANQASADRRFLGGLAASNKADSRAGAQDAKNFQIEDRMAKIYDAQTKTYREELDATRKVTRLTPTLLGRPLNAIDQQSIAVLLNKFLDPGSVVREGEFDRVARAQGLVQRAQMIIPKLKEGVFLSPDLIKNVNELAQFYDKAASTKLQQIGDATTSTARERGLNPDSIIHDAYYQPPQARGAGGAPKLPPGVTVTRE